MFQNNKKGGHEFIVLLLILIMYIPLEFLNCTQLNFSHTDTEGTERSVRIREVSV